MNNQSESKSLTLKLLGALGVAAALAAATPLAANAQSDRVGNDSPHEERNPTQHPELFTWHARSVRPEQAPEVTTAQRAPRRGRADAQRRAVIAVVTTATPASAPSSERPDDAVGNDAPRQERNPSAHPELFVR